MADRHRTSPLSIPAVLCGGAAGALARVSAGTALTALTGSAFPFGILCLNSFGSFALGCLAGAIARGKTPHPLLYAFWGTGFLGGFTTVSTFAADTLALLAQGAFIAALVNILLNAGLGVAAATAGHALVQRRD